MAFPRYETYRDSGSDWLGEVPSNWSLETIRAVTQLKSEKNRPDLQVLSVYRDYGVIPKDSRDDNHNATSLDTSGYKAVSEGDLVVNKMKAWQGSMGVSEHNGIVSPAYITCRVDAERVYPKLLHYLLRSQPYIGVYNALSYGVRVGQWDMHYEDFKSIPLPLPDRTCQKRIANFLDLKTAEIDEAIAKKQRLIELIREQKAILINQAVTKGLNPGVPMRDSGVEWIGRVPKHWHIVPMKRVFEVRDGTHDTPEYVEPSDNTYPLITSKDFEDGHINFDNSKHISAKDHKEIIRRSGVERGDVLMSMIGGNIGKAVIVNQAVDFSIKNVALFKSRGNSELADFLSFYLESGLLGHQIAIKGRGGAQGFLSLGDIRNLFFFKLPSDELKAIVGCLKNRIEDFNLAIKSEEQGIEKLRELSQVIISDVVTGKIKI